ncbi:Uncharacterised protein [Mycobacterium tuberculosis]|nr:Uncharacterised protein [Mycobacterium tuberculosis]
MLTLLYLFPDQQYLKPRTRCKDCRITSNGGNMCRMLIGANLKDQTVP